MREAIILWTSATRRQITLPKGEAFVARYEKTSRQNLPKNITVRQTRQIGRRKQRRWRAQLCKNVTVRRKRHAQKDENFLSSGFGKLADHGMKFGAKKLFQKGLDVGSWALTSEIGQKLINEGIKHAPELYKIGTSKIKNNNLKKALESDFANYVVEETHKKEKKKGSKLSLWLKKWLMESLIFKFKKHLKILMMKI